MAGLAVKRVVASALVLAENLENIGDLALLEQLAHGLRQACGIARIEVRQWQAPGPAIANRLKDRDLHIVTPRQAFRRGRAQRLLIYGGGQAVRANSSIKSLLSVSALMAHAHLRGDARAAIAIGISKLGRRPARIFWRFILARLALATVRDRVSLGRFTALNPRIAVSLGADLAFLPSPLHDRLQGNRPPTHIIIAPCVDESEDRLLDADKVAEAALHLADIYGHDDFLLVAHDPRAAMDPLICDRVADRIEARTGRRPPMLASTDLDAYLDRYAGAAVVLTNRLHSMIFALLAGVPAFVMGDGNEKTEQAAVLYKLPILPGNSDWDDDVVGCGAAYYAANAKDRQDAIERSHASAAEHFRRLDLLLSNAE